MAEQTNENVAQTTNPEQAKYTDADVDAIINKKFASWQEKQDKAIAEAVAKVEEANRLAQMNDKEKADHERKQMEDELASLKAEKAHHTMMSQARQMLKADGLTIPDEIVSVLVTDTAEGTSEAVKAFSGMFQKAVEEAVKDRLAGSEPRRGTASAITTEQIMAIKDPNKRHEAIRENLDLFKKEK